MAAEGVKNIGGASEVEHQLCRPRMGNAFHLHAHTHAPPLEKSNFRQRGGESSGERERDLAVDKGGDGHVPGGVSGHAEAEK